MTEIHSAANVLLPLPVGPMTPTRKPSLSVKEISSNTHAPCSWYLKLGGVDIKQLSQQKLSELVGVVLQENILFSGTVADNLRFGNQEADDEVFNRLYKAASVAKSNALEASSRMRIFGIFSNVRAIVKRCF